MRIAMVMVIGLFTGCADQEIESACTSEQLVMHGAMERVSATAGTITSGDRIVGISGTTSSEGARYLLMLRDSASTAWSVPGLRPIGSADASPELTFLESADFNACPQGACRGFIARDGYINIHSVSPFVADFELTDLVTTNGATNPPLDPIAGAVSGCVRTSR